MGYFYHCDSQGCSFQILIQFWISFCLISQQWQFIILTMILKSIKQSNKHQMLRELIFFFLYQIFFLCFLDFSKSVSCNLSSFIDDKVFCLIHFLLWMLWISSQDNQFFFCGYTWFLWWQNLRLHLNFHKFCRQV